jgi:hypothetical protein
MNLSRGLLLLLFSCTASCASGPTFVDVEARIPPPAEGRGRVVFFRTTVAGTLIQPDVTLNGVEVGTAVPRGFFFADTLPGSCVVSCSTEAEHNLSFVLEECTTRFVSLELRMGLLVGRVQPVLVDPETAIRRLRGLHYTGESDRLLPEGPPGP